MAKYDGLIIPRSYNDYINKSDPLGVSQALQLTGVMDDTPTPGSSKPVKSNGLVGLSAVDVVETGNMHPVTSNAVAETAADLEPVDEVTLNNLHSVTSNAVASAMSYSTSEVNTGKKWIDGKDIYRMVVEVNSFNMFNDILPTGIDKVIYSCGIGKFTNGADVIPYYQGSNDYWNYYIMGRSMRTRGEGLTVNRIYITVEYTKTTD